MKTFHGYKTQYDYYRTSNVMAKRFRNFPFDVNDKINFRSMYVVAIHFNTEKGNYNCYHIKNNKLTIANA